MPLRIACVLFLLLVTVSAVPGQTVSHGLRVPAGFEVTEFADSKLANDIFCLTLDPQGRVVVSGPGYIRLLLDEKNEGKATRAVELVDGLREGAQGLFWEGDALWYSADGGLRRCRINNDKAGPSELIRESKTGGEHSTHAIRRGPDGWLYVLYGNNSGITGKYATLPTSPIKEPIAGVVVRYTPDLKGSEIVADGFRNAYDMDFNSDGELFTFDSDNERCVSLPWYEAIRFNHVIAGGHYGWQSPQRASWWRKPPYFCDAMPPVLTLGRGSPTGVVCYRHVQFPEAYRGGYFLLDWTFGRVYFVTLKRSGSTYTCEKQIFLEAVGDEGFAPTAAAVHPQTGDLYVSIGGRGTRGAVYRIRHPQGFKALDSEKASLNKYRLPTRSLDWQAAMQKDLVEQAKSPDAAIRLRALLDVKRHRSLFDSATVQSVVQANADHSDRHVRWAAAELLATLGERDRWAVAEKASGAWPVVTVGLASYRAEPAYALSRALHWLNVKDAPPEARLACVRLVQLTLGDLMSDKVKGTIWEGYTPRQNPLDKALTAEALPALRSAFPSGQADLDREITRTLAMLEDDDPGTLGKVAVKLTATSPPLEDIHYLTVLARLKAPRTEAITARTVMALLSLDVRLNKEHFMRDQHWPLRIGELHAELAAKDAKLNGALLAHADFGRADHALFATCPGFDRRRAAEVFLTRIGKEADFAWNPTLVELIGTLPAEKSLPVLRRLWGQAGVDEALLPVLAQHPEATDRDKFLVGLTSPQLATQRVCLQALEALAGPVTDGKHLLPLVQALRRLGDVKEEKQLREQVVKYLQRVTGQEKLGGDAKAWTAWFGKTYPDLAARLNGADGVDVAAWEKRLSKIDWSVGDVERGKVVFTKVNCASCHSGSQAIGPDLRGVAGRFSRDDMLTAIIQPSKDISPRYRTTQVETAEGKVYQGLVIYDAPDSLILQTGPAATVRLAGQQIASRRTTDISLMPAGLLDPVVDRDIADLLAYLKSLGVQSK